MCVFRGRCGALGPHMGPSWQRGRAVCMVKCGGLFSLRALVVGHRHDGLDYLGRLSVCFVVEPDSVTGEDSMVEPSSGFLWEGLGELPCSGHERQHQAESEGDTVGVLRQVLESTLGAGEIRRQLALPGLEVGQGESAVGGRRKPRPVQGCYPDQHRDHHATAAKDQQAQCGEQRR